MDSLTAPKAAPIISEPRDAATAVVHAVADHRDVAPMALAPLADAIDPSILRTLVDGGTARESEYASTVEFEYAGCSVTVTSDGEVTVEDADK